MAIDDSRRPVPVPDELTSPFWDGAREHRLVIQRCDACNRYSHPPRRQCGVCGSAEISFKPVSGKGTVYTSTVVHDTRISALVNSSPFVVAFVDLVEQEGLRLTCNLSGATPEQVAPGIPVSVTFLELGNGMSIPDFVIDDE